MIRLLSVDWDYFYPDFYNFGWSDIKDPFFAHEMIWPIRYSSKLTGRNILARDYYNPVWFYKCFWDYVLKHSSPKMVFVFDQHENIRKVLDLISDVEIYHFDQHRGISERAEELNHFNWATIYKERIKELIWFSPKWHTKDFQIKGKLLGDFKIAYPSFDIVFLCRNSAYTSAWNDDKWIKFLDKLREKLSKDCFKYEESIVTKRRDFDMGFALTWLSEQQTYLERQRIRKMNGYYDD